MSTLTESRVANVEAFLTGRGLDLRRVGEVVRSAVGEADVVLVTSSPVHGLANATSDLDTICVTKGAENSLMATQIFADDNHFETLVFDTEHMDADIAHLHEVAALPIPELAEAIGRWDKGHTVRRKYLERTVNGVAVDGSLPYIDHIPALAQAWTASSLDTAARGLVLARLAERSGERRGALGYAHLALLHLMDVVLSNHGEVFSNRKWYLLRWQRFLASRSPEREWPASIEAIEACRRLLAAAFGGDDAGAVAGLAEAVAAVGTALGCRPAEALRFASVGGVRRMPFLPGSEMVLVGRHARLQTAGPAPADADVIVTDLRGLDADRARRLLDEIRLGALEWSPW